MGANEKRIVVKNLGAGRLIVGVVQADQRIPEKRSEPAASVGKPGRRARRTNDFGQVGSHLQFRMTSGVNDGSPACLFTSRENGARELEFAQVRREREQLVGDGGSVLHLFEAIVESE